MNKKQKKIADTIKICLRSLEYTTTDLLKLAKKNKIGILDLYKVLGLRNFLVDRY